MKKVFTLLCGLFGLLAPMNAASVDDVVESKHSFIFVCDKVTNNGTVQPEVNTLVANNRILLYGTDPKKSINSGKGSVDLSVADTAIVTPEIAAKYGKYGSHLNSLRLKNEQDMMVIRLTAQSKLIIFYTGQGKEKTKARYPKIISKKAMEDALAANNNSLKNAVSKAETLNEGPTAETGKIGIARFEFVAPDDDIYYISSFNGDIYCSYIIVEANEVAGTPAVEVGEQTYENGLWYCEVSCTPQSITEEGETLPTVVTYTTDGTEPGISSPVYSAPIKCYKEQTIKFQAFYDLDGELTEDAKILNADNEANVSFSFDAPAITSDGGTFTVTSPYEGAKNFYSVNGADAVEGNGTTLTESATVTAYSQITNGEYATFTTASTSTDVYVLTAITSDQTISVSGTAIVDAEATATSTDGTVYTSEDAAVSADKAYFFVKNPTFSYIANADADNSKYQAPAGQEVYLLMSNTNITFYVADGDSIDITVTCSKNSCKDLTKEQNKDVNGNDSITAEHQCYVNLDGTNYGGEDLVLNPDGNVIKFSVVGGGYHTFQKYSGTGNIKISSIEFKYAGKSGINDLKSEAKKSAAARKVMINGRLYIETAKGTFNAAGLRVK